jgi:hypothetical protein
MDFRQRFGLSGRGTDSDLVERRYEEADAYRMLNRTGITKDNSSVSACSEGLGTA